MSLGIQNLFSNISATSTQRSGNANPFAAAGPVKLPHDTRFAAYDAAGLAGVQGNLNRPSAPTSLGIGTRLDIG